MKDYNTMIKKIEEMIDQCLMHTGLELFDEALRLFPEHTQYVAYNAGTVNHMMIGNGDAGRIMYKRSLESIPIANKYVNQTMIEEMEANTYENLMLLSLSYDEYFSWADKLRTIQPNNPILTQHRAAISDLQEKAHPWSFAMLFTGKSYNVADTSKDSGMYGAAASIYQLILKNRKELRLSLDDYSTVVMLYATAVMMIYAKCGNAMENSIGKVDRNEIDFIISDAIPLVENYVSSWPEDESAKGILKQLKECIGEQKCDENRGNTPLMEACYTGNRELVEKLIKSGVNVNATNRFSETALMAVCSAEKEYFEIVDLLLSAGASVNNVDMEYNCTALHNASANGYLDTVKKLIQQGIDMNVKTFNGNTALAVALSYNHLNVAKELILKGASPLLAQANGIQMKADLVGNKVVISKQGASIPKPLKKWWHIWK